MDVMCGPSQEEIDRTQLVICAQNGAKFVQTPKDSILGFAMATKGKIPINGLRHPVVENTSGWYLWCGEDYSQANNFFTPTHAKHVYEDLPRVSRFLGLPPGYRFLIAGDYVDVWYDESLLNV